MGLAFTEGRWQVLLLVVLTVVCAWVLPLLTLLPLALLGFILYFFRDPKRKIAADVGAILAPADGTITKIKRTDCDYVGKDAWEISIFMSPLNVHVNRSPIQGRLQSVTHRPGKFLPAMNPDAPLVNEKKTYCIQGAIKAKVVQVAGILARRTVNWVREGCEVVQGEKIGMIKLGSCTQVVIPGDLIVLVKEGDKVKAGLTILGRKNNA